MKYLILIGDGMGDWPRADFNGRTVLEAAHTPNMDAMASSGRLGLAQTIPQGYSPGSDVANMCLMGYDPARYHTGRSPIEAAAMGVDLAEGEIAFRCNLVSLAHEGEKVLMDDYSAGHVDTKSAHVAMAAVQEGLGRNGVTFHPGVSYRHLLVWGNGPLKAETTPPHDHSGKDVAGFLPKDGDLGQVAELIRGSWPILQNLPLNEKRAAEGQKPVNSIWLWGQGTKPALPPLPVSGVVVSAVDLVKGLGSLAGLEVIEVPGATGWLDTNYQGKVDAALTGLKTHDLAFLHVEAPDEAGHTGKPELKKQAIELFDKNVVGPAMKGIQSLGDCRVLLACDHYTPLEVMTHTTEPIPFVIWDSTNPRGHEQPYNEASAARAAGGDILVGHQLMNELLKK